MDISPAFAWQPALAGGCILAAVSSLNLYFCLWCGDDLTFSVQADKWQDNRNGSRRLIVLLLTNAFLQSGILNGLAVVPDKLTVPYRLGFVGGMVTMGSILFMSGSAKLNDVFVHPAAIVLSGLLVGFGTIMGNGCTSGHGICGIPRLSIRSITAVLVFMGTGIATSGIVYSTPLRDLVFEK